MNTDYDFSDKSFAGLVNTFENTQYGQQFSIFFAESLPTTGALINHTQPIDGSSVVHHLAGDTLTFDNVSKRGFADVARAVAGYFGLAQ